MYFLAPNLTIMWANLGGQINRTYFTGCFDYSFITKSLIAKVLYKTYASSILPVSMSMEDMVTSRPLLLEKYNWLSVELKQMAVDETDMGLCTNSSVFVSLSNLYIFPYPADDTYMVRLILW